MTAESFLKENQNYFLVKISLLADTIYRHITSTESILQSFATVFEIL